MAIILLHSATPQRAKVPPALAHSAKHDGCPSPRCPRSSAMSRDDKFPMSALHAAHGR